MEVFAARQRATEEDRHVNGRNFGTAETLPCPGLDEVIEESVFGWSMVGQELQCSGDAAFDLDTWPILPFSTNAQRSQAETCGRDTGHSTGAATVCIGAVKHQPSFGIGLVPEKFESCALEVIEQRKIAEGGLSTAGQ